MAVIDFDLPFFVRETQLQHGLRGNDYDRYHAYLSNRVATLRQQVHLANDKKKFLKKEITANIASDNRHLIILLFYAERCWASAETMIARGQLLKDGGRAGEKSVPGGFPPATQYRKRLNKAVKWTEKLMRVSAAVASSRLKRQCEAYHRETEGRCFAAHHNDAKAKESFLASRQIYFSLLSQCDNEESESIIRQKLNELDDRIMYCMQRLNEDVQSYVPDVVPSSGAADSTSSSRPFHSTALEWNGRQLNVLSIKVKDALREARAVPVEVMEQKVYETHEGPIPVGQVNRVLDALDRRISYCNDALAHARQDLRAATVEGSHKTELQLIVHYLLFQVAQETLHRKLFMADVYARRFHATEKALQLQSSTGGRAKKGEGIHPAQFASSQEVARVYETGLDTVEEMEMLPGVAGRADTEAYLAACRGGKLLYIGEGWRLMGRTEQAETSYRTAAEMLKPHQHDTTVKNLYEKAERCVLQMSSMNALEAAEASACAPSDIPCLFSGDGAERAKVAVGVAANVVAFPPDFQVAPAKPAFVDIASTYIDFDRSPAPATTTNHNASSKGGNNDAHKVPGKEVKKEGRSWGFKWGWGSKK